MPARLSLGRDGPGQCSAGGVPLASPLEAGGVAVPEEEPDVWSEVVPLPLEPGGVAEPEEFDEPVVPGPLSGASPSGAATPPAGPVVVCGGAGAVVTGEPLAGESATTGDVVAVGSCGAASGFFFLSTGLAGAGV